MNEKEKYLNEIIDDIEEFINDAKPARFNPGKIVIDEEILKTMIDELRSRIPAEMERSKQIVQSKQDIIEDAKIKAEAILQNAIQEASETVEDHEIVQLAKRRASDVEQEANKSASDMVDAARNEARELRVSAMEYTADMMQAIEDYMKWLKDTQTSIYSKILDGLKEDLSDIQSNKSEIEGQLYAMKHPASISKGRTMDQFKQTDTEEEKR